jgi:hypothetical protein
LGHFVVACSFRNVEDAFVWAFAGVYGPNLDNVRRSLKASPAILARIASEKV